MPTTTAMSASARRWGALWGDRPHAWAISEAQQTATYAETLRRVRIDRGEHVLDVGCGTGSLSYALPAKAQLWPMFAALCVLAIACTALYGPMASALVEMFPTRVRYTALSIPYNIGTGWFGGIQPALSASLR